tara:strand:- start:466 stop:579 length:114 start_codon:yes stop_codon:yes gene_type:complete
MSDKLDEYLKLKKAKTEVQNSAQVLSQEKKPVPFPKG